MVNREHRVNLSVQTVQQYMQQGKIGVPLESRGPSPAKLSTNAFNLWTEAIVLHIQLNQINQDGKRNKRIHMLESIQKVFNPLHIAGARIINQLLQNSSFQFKAEVAVSVGDRRNRWTTWRVPILRGSIHGQNFNPI